MRRRPSSLHKPVLEGRCSGRKRIVAELHHVLTRVCHVRCQQLLSNTVVPFLPCTPDGVAHAQNSGFHLSNRIEVLDSCWSTPPSYEQSLF